MIRLKLFIVGIFSVFVSNPLCAQNGQYQFLHLDIKDGLSHNQINTIYKDKRGFMWFGTMSGLNKYDGHTFKIFKHDVHNPTSLNDDCIVSIFEGPENKLWIATRNGINIYDPLTEQFDHDTRRVFQHFNLPVYDFRILKKDGKGNYWFIYSNDGIYKYDPLSKQTRHIAHNSPERLYNNDVSNIAEDSQGNMWLVYTNGVLEKLDLKLNKITRRSDQLSKANGGVPQTYNIVIDSDDDLWIYASATTLGAYIFNPLKNQLRHLDKNTVSGKLNSNLINNIIQDDKGMIWIATDHGGINLVNKRDFSVRYLLNREDDAKSISQNTCFVYKDNLGIVWLGTFKRGISYYHESIIKFPVYRHFASDPNSLSYEDVNSFAQDGDGNLWIGTNGGGLIYFNRKTGKYTQYKHNNKNTNSLANDVIVSLCIDHEKKLWIGTYFGGLDCFDGKTFTHYRHNEKDNNTISDDRIWAILEDSSNRLWIGAFAGGLNRFDRATKTFVHYKPFQPNSVNSAYISSLFEDRDHNIWCGSYYGIDVLMKKTGLFKHLINNPKDANSLVMNNITSITQDSRGLMWIGTLEGLDILDPKTWKYTLLLKENGLPDNMALNILEDNKHTMWLSTPKGLSNVIVAKGGAGYTYQFHNFDESDGLQGREFNQNASFKTREGELIFGGAKGFNLFMPENINYNKTIPVLALTDFQIYNKSLSPGESIDGHVILKRSITETDAINLKYNENAFSLEFADLNFFNPGKVKLEYKLQGFDKNWITSDDKSRKATYTNLDPGSYTFKVRASSNTVKNTSTISLGVQIRPPFWKTGLAYFLYVFSFISILFYIRKSGIKKIEAKFALERERQEAQHMHQLDLMKIEFFTNVSHEFRTPISLILAPVEKLLKDTDDKASHKKLQLIYQNSKRLLNMINQLLDFSKIAVQKLQLDLSEGDIITNITRACNLFTDVAEKKNIKFILNTGASQVMVFFDQDKIEKIVFNLISNALKFTPEYGFVAVELKWLECAKSEMALLEIKVKDSGIGIAAEQHGKIFERFFQNEMPAAMINQGSGIGLSITKEFVSLMGGAISVESEKGKGSCFIVRLPLKVSKALPGTGLPGLVEDKDAVKFETTYHQEKRDKNITVLIVEDNHDFRAYLKEDLLHYYTIVEATNGKGGWQKALALHPNLIVSDINMPEIDGIDFCKKIRGDKRTEHIPFILLTAFTAEEQQLIGLETGANDYMTKPFNFEVLHFKIKNLLKHQQSVKETYQKQIEAKPAELVMETPDMKFMKKVLAVVEKNVANPGFSVELLSSEMNMSRVALYKKIFSLSGKTPIEFIKSIRLKRAVQLLKMNQFTIAEVAYQVGYNDPKYFTKAFKAEFLVLPSHYFAETSDKD